MNPENKKQNIFMSILLTILPLIVGFGVQIGGAIIGVIIISVKVGIEIGLSGGVADPNLITTEIYNSLYNGSTLYIITLITVGVTAVIFPLWYYLSVRKEPKPEYKNILNFKSIIYIIILGVLIQICLSELLDIILPLFPRTFEKYMSLMENIVFEDSVILTTVLTVVFAPIAEECMTRGLTMNAAKKYMPLWVANIVQAVIFGIYHGNIVQGIYAFFIGLLCGWIAIKSKSILPAILLHLVINGSALFVTYIIPTFVQESKLLTGILSLVTGAIIFLMLKFIKVYKVKE